MAWVRFRLPRVFPLAQVQRKLRLSPARPTPLGSARLTGTQAITFSPISFIQPLVFAYQYACCLFSGRGVFFYEVIPCRFFIRSAREQATLLLRCLAILVDDWLSASRCVLFAPAFLYSPGPTMAGVMG
ncbi:hypothetical protein GGTG_01601 [Gaeumannomyces tritici R3-111a-1]|uniref:Uncharacterized protein n=1 Tax=Gaeumannomyces tritici (strain R3-111a-1) TaxID=644352 RepID=J3NK19_GAET3|nr:hypothetical protein GGTG_01601 [Gaeumannomyces tritici R3-111a-1]EJT81623.1 hypothetical protein GGTG_01601 [Gaeumannomyces tritici R3-111a-1]